MEKGDDISRSKSIGYVRTSQKCYIVYCCKYIHINMSKGHREKINVIIQKGSLYYMYALHIAGMHPRKTLEQISTDVVDNLVSYLQPLLSICISMFG